MISIVMDRLLRTPPSLYAARLQQPMVDNDLDPLRNPHSYIYFARGESHHQRSKGKRIYRLTIRFRKLCISDTYGILSS